MLTGLFRTFPDFSGYKMRTGLNKHKTKIMLTGLYPEKDKPAIKPKILKNHQKPILETLTKITLTRL